jgi:hypothetical protein
LVKVFNHIIICINFEPVFGQSIFDKFDGQDDITSIIVNKKMFDLMSKVKVDASIENAAIYEFDKNYNLKVLLQIVLEQQPIWNQQLINMWN